MISETEQEVTDAPITVDSGLDELVSQRPPALTGPELRSKLDRVRAFVKERKMKGLYLVQEGALRWLTGLRHSVVDISPSAISPITAVVRFIGTRAAVTIIGDDYELVRALPEVRRRLAVCPDVDVLSAHTLESSGSIITPAAPDYESIVLTIVAPIPPGEDDNQIQKYEWLARASRAALTEVLRRTRVGASGWSIRGNVLKKFCDIGVECNLVMVGVTGQDAYPHPVVNEDYRVAPDSFAKIAVGARYSDAMYSMTATAKFGSPLTDRERTAERAMMTASLGYACRYSPGTRESELYTAVGEVFSEIERGYKLPGFSNSAYYHHLGGPLSVLGNRDYLVQPGGTRVIGPYRMFSINPIHRETGIKVELQGITADKPGEPRILDEVSDGIPFGEFSTEIGRAVRIPGIIEV